nr:MAG TPA: hypothetical protein [Microviridae sp.]
MVLVAKESYALSVTLSALKRRACLKILSLIKVKSFRQKSENLQESKKSITFVVSIRKEVNMKT